MKAYGNSRDHAHHIKDRKYHPCADDRTKEWSPLGLTTLAVLSSVFRTISWSSRITGIALVCETQKREGTWRSQKGFTLICAKIVDSSLISTTSILKKVVRKNASLEIDRDHHFLEDQLGYIPHEDFDRDRLRFSYSPYEKENIENRFDTHYRLLAINSNEMLPRFPTSIFFSINVFHSVRRRFELIESMD